MSPETEGKLQFYLTHRNPHALDWQKWHEFVIAAHREGLQWIDADMHQYLDEHTDLDEDSKRELARLFQHESDLLRLYDAS